MHSGCVSALETLVLSIIHRGCDLHVLPVVLIMLWSPKSLGSCHLRTHLSSCVQEQIVLMVTTILLIHSEHCHELLNGCSVPP